MAQFISPKFGYTGLKVEPVQRRNEKCRCGSGKKVKHCCGTEKTYICRDKIHTEELEKETI